MDGEAEAAGEYERLRAELADFVVGALAQRMAAGEEPELSRALVEAIDRRVDEAVAARLASVEWPDPDAFADSVIAAAAGRGGGSATAGEGFRPRSRRSEESIGDRARRDPPRSRRMSNGQIGLIALIGIAVIAAAAFFFLRGWDGTGVKTETVNNVTFIEPAPDGSTNVLEPPPSNPAAPGSAGTLQNLQGPTP